ncbi:MAG: hypothetical protein ABI599_10555 [Flavobacteriales bacterium]
MDSAAEPAAGIRNPVLRWLAYSHVWLALGAALQVEWMQGSLFVYGWRAPALAFCGTIVLYAFMRLSRMEHPELGTSPLMDWYRRNRLVMLVFSAVCATTAVILAWPIRVELFRMLWPATLVAVLYVIPLWLTGGRPIGLRRLPGAKAFLIGFTWASLSVGLPLAVHGRGWDGVAVQFWLLQFSSVLSLSIVFDVRDLPHDPASFRTIPQLFGQPIAKRIAAMLQLPWLLVFLGAFAMGPGASASDTWYFTMALPIIGILFTILMIIRSTPAHSEAFYLLGIDGMLILVPLSVWIGWTL